MLLPLLAVVTGTVFADLDGNGVRDPGEPGVATVVGQDDQQEVRTGADGSYRLDVPDGGLVWARTPDGYRPGPSWGTGDIPLVPMKDIGPLTFAVAADSHLHLDPRYSGPADLAAALAQATAAAPRFLVILGDVTQSIQPDELAELDTALAKLKTPFVPVIGNHDAYDGELAWRARFGPTTYSFDVGDVHFVVFDANLPEDEIVAFVERDLGLVDRATTSVVLGHTPLPASAIARMKAAGADVFLAGHWHIDRKVDHDGLVELDTGPLLMGGMDALPGGYHLVTIDHGKLAVETRTTVRAPFLRLVAPVAPRCLRAGEPLIVAAQVDARTLTITANGVPLTFAGGWAYAGTLDAPPGTHELTLEARAGDQLVARAKDEITICRDGDRPRTVSIGAWPQPGGDATHAGAADAIELPLIEQWAVPTGGNLTSAPVVAGGAIFVAVSDLALGDTGGVLALDAATGARRWFFATAHTVRASPIAVGDLVIAVELDGSLHALDAATGSERWHRALGADLDPSVTTEMAPAAAADGVIYVGGQRRFVALDATSGDELWSTDPTPEGNWNTTLAAPAVAGDRVIGFFERSKSGLEAWTRDGVRAWRVPPEDTYSTNASPVIANDTVYLATGMGDLLAIDPEDGHVRWSRVLTDDRHQWAYAITGAPAVAGGLVLVATEHDKLWALDAATGDERWSWIPGASPVFPTHYHGLSRGLAAAPVVTGDLVWAAALDGTLTALDLATGEPRQRLDLGAPVIGGLAAAGDLLVVTGFDGTVHAFVPGPPEDAHAAGPRTPFELILLGILALRIALFRRANSPSPMR